MEALPTLLLTGAPGSGKTAIAKEICELLRCAGVRHAVVDLEALGEVGPPCDGGTFNSPLIAQNLAAMWPNYRAHGVDRLVLARVIAGTEEIAALRSAVPGAGSDVPSCQRWDRGGGINHQAQQQKGADTNSERYMKWLAVGGDGRPSMNLMERHGLAVAARGT